MDPGVDCFNYTSTIRKITQSLFKTRSTLFDIPETLLTSRTAIVDEETSTKLRLASAEGEKCLQQF